MLAFCHKPAAMAEVIANDFSNAFETANVKSQDEGEVADSVLNYYTCVMFVCIRSNHFEVGLELT